MGVPGLWAELEPCQTVTTLTALSLTKFSSPSRGFRIGIDASIWFFHAEYGREGENPELRTLFFRCAQLTNHGFLPLFVFDGPHRPAFKRGKRINKSQHALVNGMTKILDAFGFEHRTAPGEAEAELAFLNRIGVIDGILSDDVDNFLFGARTVIRNHSSTHPSAKASNSLEKSKVIVYNLPHPDIPGLEPADLIFIALCSGGDYDQTGLPSCGIKIAFGLAKAGFGKSLYQAATTMPKDSRRFEEFLVNWRTALAQELKTNSSGFLPSKKPSVAKKLPPTFPNLDTLFSYVTPITSETLNRLDLYDDLLGSGSEDGWLKKDPSLPKIAAACEFYFEWGFMESIIKRFRTVIFNGVVLRILRRAILVQEERNDSTVVLDLKFIAKHFSSREFVIEDTGASPFPSLANKIHSIRTHASTSNTLEFRLEVEPTILVKLTASGVKGTRTPDTNIWAYLDEDEDEDSDGDGDSKKKTKKPPAEPHDVLRLWIPAELMRGALPLLVENYEELQRKKEEKKANKGKRAATASPSKPRTKAKSKASAPPPTSQETSESEEEVIRVQKKPVTVKENIQPRSQSQPQRAPLVQGKSRLLAALDELEVENDVLSRPPPRSRSDPYPCEFPSRGRSKPDKDLTQDTTKRATTVNSSTSNSKEKQPAASGSGINTFFNARKPAAAAAVGSKGNTKGKGKAPSAKDRYIAMCREEDDIEDLSDDSTLPDLDTYMLGATVKPKQIPPAPTRYYDIDANDDLFSPPDTPSPIKPTTVTWRKKASVSSDDDLSPLSTLPEGSRVTKSPRKSKEHTSPRKCDGSKIVRTIADIQHPSRSNRAVSPTPTRRRLPLIDISDTETDTETKTLKRASPVEKKEITPMEAARARRAGRPKPPPPPNGVEVIDLT